MMTKIMVDIFYGEEENNDQYGITFHFENFEDARNFVDFAHEHSGCNAKISQVFMFEDDNNEQS